MAPRVVNFQRCRASVAFAWFDVVHAMQAAVCAAIFTFALCRNMTAYSCVTFATVYTVPSRQSQPSDPVQQNCKLNEQSQLIYFDQATRWMGQAHPGKVARAL